MSVTLKCCNNTALSFYAVYRQWSGVISKALPLQETVALKLYYNNYNNIVELYNTAIVINLQFNTNINNDNMFRTSIIEGLNAQNTL